MAKVALQVVKKPSFYEEKVSIADTGSGEAHSLHYAVHYPHSSQPEASEYFVDRYSEKGDVILDPFCGSGTNLLAANLSGRTAYGSDQNPLALAITEAKLFPSDITEVTLGLQSIDLRSPVNIKMYSEYFAPFYDLETFREIYNLKNHFHRHRDRIARFIQMIALSLLHGTSAGCFSVHTSNSSSLAPSDQDTLNIKRRQIPDYRAVLPRILKKTASVLRDGYPSIAEVSAAKNKLSLSDARNLHYVPTSGVDLVVTAPPLPMSKSFLTGQWLKLWFIGEHVSHIEPRMLFEKSRASWMDFMNEVLLELARVVRPGGRAVLDLGSEDHEEDLLDMVSRMLGKYWTAECLLYGDKKETGKKSVNCIIGNGMTKETKYLVLRRW